LKTSHHNALMVLLALSAIVSWGFSFIAIEIALREVDPLRLVALRFLPAAFLFFLMSLPSILRGTFRVGGKDLFRLFIVGFFAVIVYNVSLNTGQTRLPASLAALVIALNPASIALTANLWLGEKPSRNTWVGLAIGLAGVALVIFARHGTPEVRIEHLIGVAITLGAPLAWGIFTTGLRGAAPKLGARKTISAAIMIGTLPLLFFVDAKTIDIVRHASPDLILSVLFLSLGCTVYGFTAWAIVLKHFEAAKAGAFIYFVPIIAAGGSHLMLHEPLDIPLLAGLAIVLSGVSIATGRIQLKRNPTP